MATTPEQAPADLDLPLPPGTLPLQAVRAAVGNCTQRGRPRRYILAAVDRHGAALEDAIDRKIAQHTHEFLRAVRRLEVLHDHLALSLAQRRWLARWPNGPATTIEPVTCQLPSGRQIEVPRLLEPLHHIERDPRPSLNGRGRSYKLRRGRGPAMAVIDDAGLSTTDVAQALGVPQSRAWRILNGRAPLPEHAPQALEQLLGAHRTALVLRAIPQYPRSRRPISPALKALRAAGADVTDIAEALNVTPPTAQKWLAGNHKPRADLQGALEQLVGPDAAERVMAQIPQRISASR